MMEQQTSYLLKLSESLYILNAGWIFYYAGVIDFYDAGVIYYAVVVYFYDAGVIYYAVVVYFMLIARKFTRCRINCCLFIPR